MTPSETTTAVLLHPATHLGWVHLAVSDLERSLLFYQQVLGLRVQAQDGRTASLGAGGATLLKLTERLGARRVQHHTGLYHFALLVPSRVALAEVLRNLVATQTPIGGSDHLVSEALYISDPDGNGIEVYRDRPRTEWPYERGQLQMATLPLDYKNILGELSEDTEPWAEMPAETMLGHMHLHVAHLSQADQFYREVIGFERMVDYGGTASFLSAGGYHHHLGINTWAGVGALPPPPDAVGLQYFVVQLANAAERSNLLDRLQAARTPFEERADSLFVRDPSQNGILFVVAQ